MAIQRTALEKNQSPDTRTVKNGKMLMREQNNLDWPRLAQELYEAGYRGWYVLETSSPSGDVVKDTRDNLDYVRKTFKMPA